MSATMATGTPMINNKSASKPAVKRETPYWPNSNGFENLENTSIRIARAGAVFM
jgi:hypothetical protein